MIVLLKILEISLHIYISIVNRTFESKFLLSQEKGLEFYLCVVRQNVKYSYRDVAMSKYIAYLLNSIARAGLKKLMDKIESILF